VNQPPGGLELVVRKGFAIAALASALAYLLVVGPIAAIIPNPVFGRTVAPTASTFVFWVLSAVLTADRSGTD
jgi:drug/metabolite transporter superfamily protein YnfA